jgi:hypothetical protein
MLQKALFKFLWETPERDIPCEVKALRCAEQGPRDTD